MAQATILVIIGISGDLARRKLLPAIAKIDQAGALPEDFSLLGISRRSIASAEVLAQVSDMAAEEQARLATMLTMHTMDLEKDADYTALHKLFANTDQPAQVLFYLSVPPQMAQPIISRLGKAGFGKGSDTKLLLEKPFGSDLLSAQTLIDETKRYFDESQLYRIDHYLAKEMAQNIIVFRSQNSLFRQTWNGQFIEKIDITVSEQIGIEGRSTFYEQTGALRDSLQSHALQLAALTLMDIPHTPSVNIPDSGWRRYNNSTRPVR